jgi:flavin reductase (DIM6/NTAB) family NADH-FMN oxidoreductase RutF
MDPRVLQKISYGMYVICSKMGDKSNGQIADVLFQVTSEPARVAIAINKNNFTHECLAQSMVFTASIISTEAPITFIGQFGFKCGRETDKFAGIDYFTGVTGVPVVKNYALGYLEAKIVSSLDSGTHTLFIGEVVESGMLGEGEPMTYAYYHEVKRWKAPKAAPTFVALQQ